MVKLLDSFNIKGINIKNRIIIPPMAMNLADAQGGVTQEVIDHYEKMAKVGAGTIILEHCYVDIKGKNSPGQLAIDRDECIDGLREIAKVIHRHGVACGVQINHSGSIAPSTVIGQKPMGPSTIIHPKGDEMPNEMSDADIDEVKKNFKDAALRVKKAGFDFVEIHGCHGYLLNQFISPITNTRMDEYGGIRTNRIKLPLEIVEEIRREVGEDFAIFYRIAAADNIEDGITIDDAKYLAVKLVESGVDVLDVSAGLGGARLITDQQGYFVYLAEGIKSVINVPIITTGGIKEPIFAYHVINDCKADMIGIGRAILNDPLWVQKAYEQLKDIE
ncbi:NADH:flavin oxidoreductase [Irregularibacter muris]|uniref:NADH:flavin oxidoreductase n=1 Tax=Irregularibacter muris TaxID=1796619 RepID=A0AAE3HE32_9FIRM|nr:NADH:flavin oxidoreductase [Irregularibacter muris]MCR1897770.1 NADH:flavin oxidoreductase [Irregularibacter muris]